MPMASLRCPLDTGTAMVSALTKAVVRDFGVPQRLAQMLPPVLTTYPCTLATSTQLWTATSRAKVTLSVVLWTSSEANPTRKCWHFRIGEPNSEGLRRSPLARWSTILWTTTLCTDFVF